MKNREYQTRSIKYYIEIETSEENNLVMSYWRTNTLWMN